MPLFQFYQHPSHKAITRQTIDAAGIGRGCGHDFLSPTGHNLIQPNCLKYFIDSPLVKALLAQAMLESRAGPIIYNI